MGAIPLGFCATSIPFIDGRPISSRTGPDAVFGVLVCGQSVRRPSDDPQFAASEASLTQTSVSTGRAPLGRI